MGRETDGILSLPIRFARETLGLSPNQVSVIGLVAGLGAAVLVAAGFTLPGLAVMAVSQILDGMDGGMARRYGLASAAGRKVENVIDRTNELAIFLALAISGLATYTIVALAFVAILLVTMVEPYSHFDPGFKRFMIYFGYLAVVLFHVDGFQIALNVVFFANLAAFAAGTVMADYRLQREIDTQAMIRRDRERAMGLPLPPDDPPSFLSKLFA